MNALVRETVEALGYVLVESVWIGGKNRNTLRVVIHKPGEDVAITDCEKVSEVLSGRLDVEDFIADSYNLVVESPGADRKIARPEEYDIFREKEFRFVLKDPAAAGRKDDVVIGKVLERTDDELRIETADGELRVPLKGIAKANIYFDMKRYL